MGSWQRGAAAGALAIASLTACSHGINGVALGPNKEKVVKLVAHYAPADARRRVVIVRTPGMALRLEVAADKFTLEHGLMDRTSLPAGHGMLFVSPWDGDHLLTMWMKRTRIPLDMVFVTQSGEVTRIAQSVPPSSPFARDYQIARRFGHGHYVIEMPSGEAVRDGLIRGARVTLPSL